MGRLRRGNPEDDVLRAAEVGEPELVGGGASTSSPDGHVIESATGPLGHWWQRLSRSARRTVVLAAAVGAALLAALATYLTQPQRPGPTPWPALRATVAYHGRILSATGTSQRTAAFVITVANSDTAPMEVTQIRFTYLGLTLRTEPPLPVSVKPGQVVTIRLVATASDCTEIPRDDRLPFVDVTFGNTRAMEQESEILGDRYTADLHSAMNMACRRS